MVLHRSTVYINLISGITAGAAALEDEKKEAKQYDHIEEANI